jgi:hypothetical protein
MIEEEDLQATEAASLSMMKLPEPQSSAQHP